MPLFVISLWMFVKPLITSCQIRHRRKICHCPKNRQLSTYPFSHLIWIFGQTLDEFLAHSPYLWNFVFGQYSPLCHLIWGFNHILGGFLLNSPFSQIAIFVKNANCQYDCFVVSLSQSFPNSPVRFAKYVIFVKPTIIDMPLFSSCFNFCQTLNKFFPNLSFS